MDACESGVGSLGAYAAVRQRLEQVVAAQQKAYEELQQSVIKCKLGMSRYHDFSFDTILILYLQNILIFI